MNYSIEKILDLKTITIQYHLIKKFVENYKN